MAADELKSALQDANEVELTVTGRKTGNQSSRPIWFVLEGTSSSCSRWAARRPTGTGTSGRPRRSV